MSVNRSETKVSSSEILRRSEFSPMKFGLFSDQALRRLEAMSPEVSELSSRNSSFKEFLNQNE
jgi:hypothetical protein